MLKNPRIEIVDDGCFGYTGSYVLEAGRDLTERDFKKWFNHVYKRLLPPDTAYAYSDDEEYEGCQHEWSQWWGIQEMQNDPNIPFA